MFDLKKIRLNNKLWFSNNQSVDKHLIIKAGRGISTHRKRTAGLTDDDGVVGHLLRVLPVIVERQVPDSRVQVLDESGFVDVDGPRPPDPALRLEQAAFLFGDEPTAVKKFHKIILKMKESRFTTADTQRCPWKHSIIPRTCTFKRTRRRQANFQLLRKSQISRNVEEKYCREAVLYFYFFFIPKYLNAMWGNFPQSETWKRSELFAWSLMLEVIKQNSSNVIISSFTSNTSKSCSFPLLCMRGFNKIQLSSDALSWNSGPEYGVK